MRELLYREARKTSRWSSKSARQAHGQLEKYAYIWGSKWVRVPKITYPTKWAKTESSLMRTTTTCLVYDHQWILVHINHLTDDRDISARQMPRYPPSFQSDCHRCSFELPAWYAKVPYFRSQVYSGVSAASMLLFLYMRARDWDSCLRSVCRCSSHTETFRLVCIEATQSIETYWSVWASTDT